MDRLSYFLPLFHEFPVKLTVERFKYSVKSLLEENKKSKVCCCFHPKVLTSKKDLEDSLSVVRHEKEQKKQRADKTTRIGDSIENSEKASYVDNFRLRSEKC